MFAQVERPDLRQGRQSLKTALFFTAILSLTFLGTYVLSGMIDFRASSYWPAIIWLAGFGIMALNNAHMIVCSVVALWPGQKSLPEAEHSSDYCTDILYIVRNENTDLLFTAMLSSLAGIATSNTRVWLLSNSDNSEFQMAEDLLVSKLQADFGAERVHLFRTLKNPLRRKHVCIHEWLEVHSESSYVFICDADTVVPVDSVEKLIRKANHPDNAEIVLFQSHLRNLRAETRFVRMLSFGQEIAQRLYTATHQRIFGRSAYYGSGCLIRTIAYRNLNVPAWVLSHDIWETVAFEQNAGRVVYCHDVVTFGSFPHNMLDFMRRSRRWILGTTETFPLLARPGVPLGTRFLVLLPIYLYLIQPLLIIWIALGFILSSSVGPFLAVQTFASAGAGYVHLEMSSCLIFTMVVVFGHRFTQCRALGEIGETALELAASIIVCLNCILFDSMTVVLALIRPTRAREWVPTPKQNRPPKFTDVALKLWPSTLLGLIATVVGLVYAFNWTLAASPFLVSFCLGIPAAYWTGQRYSVIGGSSHYPPRAHFKHGPVRIRSYAVILNRSLLLILGIMKWVISEKN
ncbi:MAG TPA: glycosyltransferase family 2 protein [Pyrinomonadaceae bacterium]|nr:glycosyltransferase family 2 protein [Pyrinomonadaceae bacterium]